MYHNDKFLQLYMHMQAFVTAGYLNPAAIYHSHTTLNRHISRSYNLHSHQHKDYPVVGKFSITIDFKDGTPSRTINDIESQEKVQGILRELYRDDYIQKITVVGEDKFGNRSKNEVKMKLNILSQSKLKLSLSCQELTTGHSQKFKQLMMNDG